MYSLYKQKQQDKVRTSLQANEKQKAKRILKRNTLSEKAKVRLAYWENKNVTAEISTVMQEGTMKLMHPQFHKFRGDNQNEYNNIYVRKYQPDKQKANEAEQKNRESRLDEPYSPTSSANAPNWLRAERPESMIGPRALRFVYKSQAERLTEADMRIRNSSAEPMNAAMYQRPNWRSHDKIKWQQYRDFNCYSKTPTASSAWKTTKNSNDKYIDGLENLGALSRARDKNMELAGEFSLSANLSNTNKALAPCDSISTLKSMKYATSSGKLYKKSLECSFNEMYQSTMYSKSKKGLSFVNASRL